MRKERDKNAPRVRLELTTYRLTAGRAADCAIQELCEALKWVKSTKNSPRRDSNPQSLPPEGSALSIRPQGQTLVQWKKLET